MRQLSSILKGCVLHMPLAEETYNPATRRFTDKSGYGNHGTAALAAGFTSDRMGQTVRAMDFDGVGDYIECGDHPANGEYTISTWSKCGSTGHRSLFAFSAMGWLNIDYGASHQSLLRLGDANFRWFANSPCYTDGNWHLLSIYIPGANRLDVDNSVLRIDGDIITPVETNNTGEQLAFDCLNICKGGYMGSAYFDGDVADFWIHNRALTESERTFLYESYNPSVII